MGTPAEHEYRGEERGVIPEAACGLARPWPWWMASPRWALVSSSVKGTHHESTPGTVLVVGVTQSVNTPHQHRPQPGCALYKMHQSWCPCPVPGPEKARSRGLFSKGVKKGELEWPEDWAPRGGGALLAMGS